METHEIKKPSILGRPTKYKEEYAYTALDRLQKGWSCAEVCRELDICPDTFIEWQKKFPLFSEAIKKGRYHARAIWERKGRQGIENKDFNSQLWYMNMRNRFNYHNKQYEAIKDASQRRGEDNVNLALLTDGLRAEREQGITIDVAYRYFATPKRKFIIADTPGHIQYTRNMVTGASTANLAVDSSLYFLNISSTIICAK